MIISTVTTEGIINNFENEEAANGRPCIVARVRDFLQADWLAQDDRDWLAGVLVSKDYHTAAVALDHASAKDLYNWAVVYDWPECSLLGDSYDPRLVYLLDDLECAEGWFVIDGPNTGDLTDTVALYFGGDLDMAIDYLRTDEHNFRVRKLLSKDGFLHQWTKPAEAYGREKEANEDGFSWCDELGRWCLVGIDDREEC